MELLRVELAQARQAQSEAERRLEEERARRAIAEFRAEHFFRQSIDRPDTTYSRVGLPLRPCPPADIPARGTLAVTAPDFLRGSSCMFCMSDIDSTGGYMLGCGHTFHLACLSESMARLAQCVICRHPIDLATYRVLGIDDVYPGIRQVDARTRAPLELHHERGLGGILTGRGARRWCHRRLLF